MIQLPILRFFKRIVCHQLITLQKKVIFIDELVLWFEKASNIKKINKEFKSFSTFYNGVFVSKLKEYGCIDELNLLHHSSRAAKTRVRLLSDLTTIENLYKQNESLVGDINQLIKDIESSQSNQNCEDIDFNKLIEHLETNIKLLSDRLLDLSKENENTIPNKIYLRSLDNELDNSNNRVKIYDDFLNLSKLLNQAGILKEIIEQAVDIKALKDFIVGPKLHVFNEDNRIMFSSIWKKYQDFIKMTTVEKQASEKKALELSKQQDVMVKENHRVKSIAKIRKDIQKKLTELIKFCNLHLKGTNELSLESKFNILNSVRINFLDDNNFDFFKQLFRELVSKFSDLKGLIGDEPLLIQSNPFKMKMFTIISFVSCFINVKLKLESIESLLISLGCNDVNLSQDLDSSIVWFLERKIALNRDIDWEQMVDSLTNFYQALSECHSLTKSSSKFPIRFKSSLLALIIDSHSLTFFSEFHQKITKLKGLFNNDELKERIMILSDYYLVYFRAIKTNLMVLIIKI